MTSHDRREQTKTAASQARSLTAIGAVLAAVYALVPPVSASTTAPRPVAAARAVADPARGAYWHTRTLWAATHPRRLGSGSNRYRVEERQVSETWITPGGKEWFGFRELGVRPKSAADERAWRRDGSPDRWSRTADGRTVALSTRPDKGKVTPTKGRSDVFYLAGQQLSYEELQRLPEDPAALKGWIEKAVRVKKANPAANVPEEAVDGHVAGRLVELLHRFPVPRNVRVAACQALPTIPLVHVRGKAKDALGRTGEHLSIDHRQERGNEDSQATTEVIIDTEAMLLLSHRLKVTIDGKSLANELPIDTMLHVGWTDSPPSVPALP